MGVLKYAESPFRQELAVPVGHRMVKLGEGKDNKTALVNIDTGEEIMSAVFAHKKVDKDRFVKMFTENIAITHNLGLAGRRACDILQWVIQEQAINKDYVWLGLAVLDDWNKRPDVHKKISNSAWYRGVGELIDAGIIARKDSGRGADYWLNPNIMFNGDRFAVVSVIEKDEQAIEGEVVAVDEQPKTNDARCDKTGELFKE